MIQGSKLYLINQRSFRPTVSIIAPKGCSAGAREGRQAVRVRRVLLARAQPLRDPHLGLQPPTLAGGVQQPPRVLLPPADRLPAAVLRIPPPTGQGLVEVPTALPRDNVQRRDVFRLTFF